MTCLPPETSPLSSRLTTCSRGDTVFMSEPISGAMICILSFHPIPLPLLSRFLDLMVHPFSPTGRWLAIPIAKLTFQETKKRIKHIEGCDPTLTRSPFCRGRVRMILKRTQPYRMMFLYLEEVVARQLCFVDTPWEKVERSRTAVSDFPCSGLRSPELILSCSLVDPIGLFPLQKYGKPISLSLPPLLII